MEPTNVPTNVQGDETLSSPAPLEVANLEIPSNQVPEGTSAMGRRRGRWYRHTPFQIQELESYYKDCPHPDKSQRQSLADTLGLDPKQIKFWFQNKRTQMKTQSERSAIKILMQDNEILLAENQLLKDSIRNLLCHSCSSPAIPDGVSNVHRYLMTENARRRGKTPHGGILRPLASSSLEVGEGDGSGNQTCWYANLALTAMEELLKLAHADFPLWFTGINGGKVILTEDEYLRAFPRCLGSKPLGFASEASKESTMVGMSSSTLVDTLMDPNKWAELFSSIIANAGIIEVIFGSSGGIRSGVLQLMEAELCVLSPLVPTRRVKFLRYCKQIDESLWAVVDVSVNPRGSCRRLPSGCIIEDMGNECSKIIWVEHTEYDESEVHPYCESLIRSGTGFGAVRWLGALKRHCESRTLLMSTTNGNFAQNALNPICKMQMLELTQRMIRSFCSGICAPISGNWEKLLVTGLNNDVKMMAQANISEPGKPAGLVISATTSVCMSATQDRLFQFLTNLRMRSHWDVLCHCSTINESIILPGGQESSNTISLVRASKITNGSESYILQETWQDESGAMIVFAPIDVSSLTLVMNGSASTNVAVLPSGFTILPNVGEKNDFGCLLTVSFQILVDNSPSAQLTWDSIGTINKLVSSTVVKIKDAMSYS